MTDAAPAPAPGILLIEDDEHIAFILRFLLERSGFEVELASDGRQAVARLESPPPALVLMDIMLPYHDGLEILARLRNQPAWGEVPVLMLTAKAREGDIVRALDLGADDYVTKPFQPEEVLARVRRALRRPG
jgi:DNA-binding response OmpR family regulator